MRKETFDALLHLLLQHGLTHGEHIKGDQKIGIFIDAFKGCSNRDMQKKWQHSGFTIFHVEGIVECVY
jgi:hypothetical protein